MGDPPSADIGLGSPGVTRGLVTGEEMSSHIACATSLTGIESIAQLQLSSTPLFPYATPDPEADPEADPELTPKVTALACFVVNFPWERTVFPYCYCNESCGPIMTDYVTKNKTISFTIKSNPDCPMWGSDICTMDIGKIEINTFTACRFSDVYAYTNGDRTRLDFDNSGFDGVQLIKLNQIGISLSDLATQDLAITLEIPVDATTYGQSAAIALA
eukprot:gene16942-23216_t